MITSLVRDGFVLRFFRKNLVKKTVAYAVVTSFLGLSVVQTAQAGQSAMEASQAASAARSGDYSKLREMAGQSSSAPKDNFSTNINSNDNLKNLYGAEEDRAYNNNHESLKDGGSDGAFNAQGNLFKSQIATDEESSEGKAYKLLNDMGKSSEYHERNKKNESMGKRLSLVVEDSSIVDEYKRMADDAEAGTVCRVVIDKPEVVESVTVKKEYDCTVSDSPIFIESSCTVERTLTLPGAQNGSGVALSKWVGASQTNYSSSFTYPHDLALDKKLKFTLESKDSIAASLTFGDSINSSKQAIVVNGNKLNNNSGTHNISQFLKEGENVIEASCDNGKLLPTNNLDELLSGYYGINDVTERCSVNNDGVLNGVLMYGELAWGSIGFASRAYRQPNAENNSGACPTGFFQVGNDNNMDRGHHDASESMKRCFKPYDEPICTAIPAKIQNITTNASKQEFAYWYDKLRHKIVNPGPVNSDQFLWPNWSQADNDGSDVIPLLPKMMLSPNRWAEASWPEGCSFESCYRLWFSAHYGSYLPDSRILTIGEAWFGESPVYRDGYQPDDFTCAPNSKYNSLGPCRAPSLKGATNGMYDRWKNANTFQQFVSEVNALNTAKYAKGCGHPQFQITLKLNHPNAIEKKTETPANCVSGNNQITIDRLGNRHYNLVGKAFDYTNTATPPSTNAWRCDDSSSNKLHGAHIQTQATSNLVYDSISALFPGDKQSSQVCYKAVAPKYALDITNESCPDGNLSCWGDNMDGFESARAPNNVPKEFLEEEYFLVKVLSKISIFNKAHAAIGGPTLGDAMQENSCTVYAENSSCKLVKEECTLINSYTGQCTYYSKKYECDEAEEKVVQEAQVRTECQSAIPCSNDDETCTYDDSGDMQAFQDAAVLLSVAQFADNDTNCIDPSDISTCSMFNGRKAECSTRKSTISTSCCNNPGGAPGPMEYVKVLYAAYKTDYIQNSLVSVGTKATSSGMWTNYVTPIGESISAGWDVVVDASKTAYDAVANKFKDWFVSEATATAQQTTANAVGAMAGEAASSGIMASMSATANFAGARLAEMMGNVLGDWAVESVLRDKVTGAIVEETTAAAANAVQSTAINSSIVNGIGTAVTVVGWIYLAYQIANLVHSVLTSCDPEEMEAAYSIASNSCYKVQHAKCTGSNMFGCYENYSLYCCYNSMLGRIIHEQARITGQLSGSWNQTYDNGCPGITFEQFSNLDFNGPNKIDLQEWINALVSAGQIPDATAASKTAFTNMDNMTRNLAEMQDDFESDPDKYENALGRSKEIFGVAGGDYESYRDIDRDMLIMGDQYTEEFEECVGEDRYVSDGEIASIARRPFVIYADGSKNFIGGCSRSPDSPTFPISTEICGSYEDDGGNIIDRVIKFFQNEFGERVNATSCQ